MPNITATLAVQTSLSLSIVILVEAALSFLGLGTQPPAPSWGGMLSRGRQYMTIAPWLVLAPGLAIMLAVLGFNLLGDAQRDLLDPRRSGERREEPMRLRPDRGDSGPSGVRYLRRHLERRRRGPGGRFAGDRGRGGAAARAFPSCIRGSARRRSAPRRAGWGSSWWPG